MLSVVIWVLRMSICVNVCVQMYVVGAYVSSVCLCLLGVLQSIIPVSVWILGNEAAAASPLQICWSQQPPVQQYSLNFQGFFCGFCSFVHLFLVIHAILWLDIRVTESQNDCGWKGPLEVTWSNPLLMQDLPEQAILDHIQIPSENKITMGLAVSYYFPVLFGMYFAKVDLMNSNE